MSDPKQGPAADGVENSFDDIISASGPATKPVATPDGASTVSWDAPPAPQPVDNFPSPATDWDEQPKAAADTEAAGEVAEGQQHRVRLSVSRIDPWSATKLSFLLSVVAGVMIVVASATIWGLLNAMQVFSSINDLFVSLNSQELLSLMGYLAFDKWISFTVLVAVFEVVLLTVLGTIGSFAYNLVARLVGGLHLTLSDD